MNTSIVWFRNDLRIHDNEALVQAIKATTNVIPIYVFDERIFKGNTKYGFKKTDKFRTKFILESVRNLRNNIENIGGNLIIRIGNPEEVIYEICNQHKVNWVYCNRERTKEEVDVQDALEKNLWSIGVEMRYTRGKMLYYTADLPFPITHSPDQFTTYRKEVEKIVPVREPLPSPKAINFPQIELDHGSIPTLSDFGHTSFTIAKGIQLKGGETEGLNQLAYYLEEKKLVSNYKHTRNQLLGRDYSSKLSAYLAQGCLSPKMIYHQLKQYEHKYGNNESTYWLFFELLWRDFFRLIAKKYGNAIFLKDGIRLSPKNAKLGVDDMSRFAIWKEGRTGFPFVDANMKELNETGYMSNRGRQIVASFLINELGLNWIIGAEYFESLLIDYDPASNYGNWNYLAGVGTDPRQDRHFNVKTQCQKYDPLAEYIKFWLPELKSIPAEKLFDTSCYDEEDEVSYGVKLGKDYPMPCIGL